MVSVNEAAGAALGSELLALIRRLGGVVRDRFNVRTFLVGGGVRDILLGRPTVDVDILVEGDATAVARGLHDSWAALFADHPRPKKPEIFKRYGTAKLLFPSEVLPGLNRLDFASARTERYPVPGGAPDVRYPATLDEDLGRRDFTVNAIACSIEDELTVVDPYRGTEDLRAGLLRILHGESFVDDPARLLRGARFADRFSLRFDDVTSAKFAEACRARRLSTVPFQRRFDELRKALEEDNVARLLERLDASELLDVAVPGLHFGARERAALARLDSLTDVKVPRGIAVAAALLSPRGRRGVEEVLAEALLPRHVVAAGGVLSEQLGAV